jgi:transcriptional regulator with XRE-family HTH domain
MTGQTGSLHAPEVRLWQRRRLDLGPRVVYSYWTVTERLLDAGYEPIAFDRGSEPSQVGGRLREHRERRGISLRELARRVGVSPSLVSQIELDRVNPSVSTLYALVTELGMTMSEVFGDARPGEPIVRPRAGGDGLAESPETRRVVDLSSGVRWERLTRHRDPEVEFLHVVYPVGAESCPDDALITHGGREYGYVESGTMGVRVGFDEYELGPGGSISFDSSSPHRLWAIGAEPVHAIWVVIGRAAALRTESPSTAPAAGE